MVVVVVFIKRGFVDGFVSCWATCSGIGRFRAINSINVMIGSRAGCSLFLGTSG